MTTKVILFDLGGVIVHWVGIQALSEMTGLSTSEVGDKFKYSDTANAYERGLCSNQVFIRELRHLFALSGTDEELAQLWNSWVQEPYRGIEDAIVSLKQTYRVACLSNTNDLHWEHLKTYLDLNALFEPAYASHQIHMAKPDKDCFEFVIQDMNVEAGEILFLDDTQANIDAAINSGMQALKVDPTFGALPVLEALNLLS